MCRQVACLGVRSACMSTYVHEFVRLCWQAVRVLQLQLGWLLGLGPSRGVGQQRHTGPQLASQSAVAPKPAVAQCRCISNSQQTK
jgi:hypothetical protein